MEAEAAEVPVSGSGQSTKEGRYAGFGVINFPAGLLSESLCGLCFFVRGGGTRPGNFRVSGFRLIGSGLRFEVRFQELAGLVA